MTSLIAIGKVTAPHGVAGEIRILPLTDFPERFRQLKKVYLSGKGMEAPRLCTVTGVKYHKKFVILKLAGVENRDEAEKLRNCYLKIEPAELMPLPPGHYYHFQIVGLKVETMEEEALGEVVEILTPGGNDVYVVQDREGNEVLIPAIKEVVREIDLERGLMRVELLEGLR
ncbi:MAG TPA: 16S rRNA processing protein RimM [Firmicutes bacterium]|nr:16S rRNA processing protein RimM [Bacillota bacterium]